MEHISFLFYLVSLITGTISIGISFVIYSQYRKPVIRLYLLFLTAFSMILVELFSVPAYFFCINCLSILFTVRHFNQPPYLEQGKLTPHFRKKFGITDRETEITALFIQGQSYNQIGEQLFISYKTVDNHIRNIYRKTDVKNRLQLLNLVRSNAAV